MWIILARKRNHLEFRVIGRAHGAITDAYPGMLFDTANRRMLACASKGQLPEEVLPMRLRLAIASTMWATMSLANPNGAAAQSSGDQVHEFNAPLLFTVINPCTREPVALEGNVDLLIQTTTPPTGGLLVKTHVATTGRALAQWTNVNYTFGNETDLEAHTMEPADNFTLTQKQAVHLTSAGREDNFVLLILLHTTINSNGAGAAVENITCKCAGAGGAGTPEPEEVKCVALPKPPQQ